MFKIKNYHSINYLADPFKLLPSKGLRSTYSLKFLFPVPRKRVLKELHWLKIDERIEYKIALQMYKGLSNEGPAYLTRDLVPVANLPEKQRLRSAKSKDVVTNKHKLKSLGLRRFSVSGPKLWNNLPNSLKSSSSTNSFCRSLKTYLFNKSFPPS